MKLINKAIIFTAFLSWLAVFPGTVKAQSFWPVVSKDVGSCSLAKADQLKEIFSVVAKELSSSHSNSESIQAINRKLAKLGLSEIKADSTELKVDLVKQAGFYDSTDVGVEISDGAFKFCFPCSVGHNDYVAGIFPAGVLPTDKCSKK